MINPYQTPSIFSATEPRRLHFVIAPLAGSVGYCAPIVALALMAWFTNGWPVALENLKRVVHIHRELSLNTIATFIPNLTLATIVAIATIKWVDSDESHRRWWMLGCVTIIGYTVVLYSVGRWNLIPWTWPTELNNAVRSTLTLMFPIIACAIDGLASRRTRRRTSRRTRR